MSYGQRSLQQLIIALDEGISDPETVREHARQLVNNDELDEATAVKMLNDTEVGIDSTGYQL